MIFFICKRRVPRGQAFISLIQPSYVSLMKYCNVLTLEILLNF